MSVPAMPPVSSPATINSNLYDTSELMKTLGIRIAELTRIAQVITTTYNRHLAISNTTANRPTTLDLSLLENSGVGFTCFDTTLGIPIWWDGTNWVDATGATV